MVSTNKDAVAIEGVRELARMIGKIDPKLRKELGQRNKAIGQEIIDDASPSPLAVGMGTGSVPRASATTNVLRIMMGGSHRTGPPEKRNLQQWGPRFKDRDVKRPYIRRSAEENVPGIEQKYLKALLEVAHKAGFDTKRNLT